MKKIRALFCLLNNFALEWICLNDFFHIRYVLIGLLVCWFVGWLVDWLIDWFAGNFFPFGSIMVVICAILLFLVFPLFRGEKKTTGRDDKMIIIDFLHIILTGRRQDDKTISRNGDSTTKRKDDKNNPLISHLTSRSSAWCFVVYSIFHCEKTTKRTDDKTIISDIYITPC